MSLVQVKEYELYRENFSDTGSFGFGIQEHIDLGLKYDPSIGIYGMDFYVVLDRAGRRVAKRRRAKGTVGPSHRVQKDESIKWFQQKVEFSSFPISPCLVRWCDFAAEAQGDPQEPIPSQKVNWVLFVLLQFCKNKLLFGADF